LSGGFAGHIYGSGGWDGGVWRGDVEEASRVTVAEGMKWPGAAQMGHLKTFMLSEGSSYQQLIPCVRMMNPNRHGPVASYDGWAYCAATEDRGSIFAYLEKGTPETTVEDLKPETSYRITWFDPRLGNWGAASEARTDASGKITLPSKPTEDDWAIKMILISR
ncbi:MAG: putative collagen-binding domain-containing protein, partial [Treponemataceae bacterium]